MGRLKAAPQKINNGSLAIAWLAMNRIERREKRTKNFRIDFSFLMF